MKTFSIAVTALVLMEVGGCEETKVTLDQDDLAVATATGVPEDLLLELKTAGSSLRRR
jgi:hypothetical protein